MPISHSQADNQKVARDAVFAQLAIPEGTPRISNQSFAFLVVDADGTQRMVELRAIVRAIDDLHPAEELLTAEVEAYAGKQDKKQKEKVEHDAKATADKAKREAAKKKTERHDRAAELARLIEQDDGADQPVTLAEIIARDGI